MKRQVFLTMKSPEEAQDLFFSRFKEKRVLGVETVATPDSIFRITAEPVYARISSPTFHAAAMDGVAVEAEKTFGVTERNPKRLMIGRDAYWINTGQPLPKGLDAVIMVEKLHQADEQILEINSPVYPWQNVRKVGEDIVATELLLPQNHFIRSFDLGALIAGGIFQLKVRCRPRVAIIPTGNELLDYRTVERTEDMGEGRFLEYNSIVLAALVREADALAEVYPIVKDDLDSIVETLNRAVNSDADVIIVNAGSSAGSKDYTYHAISHLGEVFVHGVSMMPGKPTVLGVIRGKPIIGNPGYPVSATISFERFVRPFLYRLVGLSEPSRRTVMVQPTRDIPSKPGIEELVRVNIGVVRNKAVATPLPRSAGSITTLTRAEGIIRIPALSEGISENEAVEAELYVNPEEIKKTIMIIGSHDMTIDVLADEIRAAGKGFRISSGNVGSMGGLMALRKGAAHAAGSHLLDTETGDYNFSYLHRYLKGTEVALFRLVWREQGLMVKKGNPLNIKGVEDLKRDDVNFVSRQPGSGTRILLDFMLKQSGIPTSAIRGYGHEETTHMAVAVDILSGAADAGLGIYAAARALGLGFIPIIRERYDLVVPTEYMHQEKLLLLLDIARSERFRQRVKSMGGYDASESGELLGTYS